MAERDKLGLPKRILNLQASARIREKTKEKSAVFRQHPVKLEPILVMKKETSGPVLRPVPPGGMFCSPISSSSASSPFAASTSFGFCSQSSTFFHNHDDNRHDPHHHRPASPTRVNLSSTPLSHSVRFSIDHRSSSSKRSFTVSKRNAPLSLPKKSCMCSPTNHPGSFRCSLHKNLSSGRRSHHQAPSYPSNRLNMRRSAMKNSLVRIGGVEGDLVKRALTALIRPSSHQLRRRFDFQPRPSRLSVMSKAEDL